MGRWSDDLATLTTESLPSREWTFTWREQT